MMKSDQEKKGAQFTNSVVPHQPTGPLELGTRLIRLHLPFTHHTCDLTNWTVLKTISQGVMSGEGGVYGVCADVVGICVYIHYQVCTESRVHTERNDAVNLISSKLQGMDSRISSVEQPRGPRHSLIRLQPHFLAPQDFISARARPLRPLYGVP